MTERVDAVYFGPIDAMIAEVSAHDMGKAWFKETGYRYAMLILGDAQYTTEYFTQLRDAKAAAQEAAEHYGVRTVRV